MLEIHLAVQFLLLIRVLEIVMVQINSDSTHLPKAYSSEIVELCWRCSGVRAKASVTD